MSEREMDLIRSLGHCPWCKKQVSIGHQNLYDHCNGRPHQQAIHRWVQQDVDDMERHGWHCRSCDIRVSSHPSTATTHVKGRSHYVRAAKKLVDAYNNGGHAHSSQSNQSQSHSSNSVAFDPEIEQIIRTGRCLTCRKPVGQHQEVATTHVNGQAHRLFKTLGQADWKSGLNELQKSAEGLEFVIFIGKKVQPKNAPIVVELNTPLKLELYLRNNSGRIHMLRRLLVMPPATANHINMNLRLESSQLPLANDGCLLFEKLISMKDLDRIGRYELLFAFSFAKALLLQTVILTVIPPGNRAISEQQAAAASNPFVAPKKRNPNDAHRLAQSLDANVVVPGERLTREKNAQELYVRQLPFFDLPNPLPPRAVLVRAIQPPLSAATYAKRFSTLLQLEEIQMCVDILGYDRESTFTKTPQRPNLLRLQVDGLSESRPSVQMGDSIWASLTPIGENSRPKGVFEGCVHHVERDYVFLKFHANFHASHIPGTKYHIRFRFNRIPIRRMHMGIRDLVVNGAQTRLLMEGNASTSSSSFSSLSNVPSLLVTDNAKECEDWIIREVFDKKITHVGLDTESQPLPYKPNQLALIQIATRTAVLIYRVFQPNRSDPIERFLGTHDLPYMLQHLLMKREILKFSIGDEKELLQLLYEERTIPSDFQNLQASELGGRNPQGQAKSTQTLANDWCPRLKFVKDKNITLSDWGRNWPLTRAQQVYAANDALIAYSIGTAIMARKAGQHPLLPTALIGTTHTAAVAPASSSASSTSSSSSTLANAKPLETHNFQKLNEIQQKTVTKILQGNYHPRPFLLFGPPGTGKTTVLVESINQLLRSSSTVRILAVAPSNSAADLFIERLTHLNTMEMFRLNAISRVVSTTSDIVKKYSKVIGDGFVLIDRASVLKYRLVVTTAVSASCLCGVGCQPGDFTHIIFDEAGHATEPESLAALGGLVDLTKTRIVLGGDPKQLGPVVRSVDAIKGGLGISLLERLMQPYMNDDDDDDEDGPGHSSGGGGKGDQFMTKLLYNYRSHPQILAAPNALFYNNDLIAAADPIERRSLCSWPEFPNQGGFPLLFHHIVGKEQREASSPSWFNLDEVALISTYVTELLAFRKGGLTARDIGIIAPYHRQVTQIRASMHTRFEQLGRQDWVDLKVGSCEEFQGQERRVILISTVRSQMVSLESFDVKFQLGFVQQPKRMNVAITRAKQALIIVGNGEVLKTDRNWLTLLRHCQNNQAVRGIPLKLGSNDSSSHSSTSSSSMDEDGQLLSGLEQLIAMKVDAERAADQAAEIAAGNDRDGDIGDGWTLVPSSDQPWKSHE